jgi:hypothetical protein
MEEEEEDEVEEQPKLIPTLNPHQVSEASAVEENEAI